MVDGLDEVEVESGFTAASPVVLLAIAGNSDDDRIFASLALAKLPCDFVAVHAGKPDVEENHVRTKCIGGRDCLRSVIGCADVVTQELKQSSEPLGRVGVVVNDKDAGDTLGPFG